MISVSNSDSKNKLVFSGLEKLVNTRGLLDEVRKGSGISRDSSISRVWELKFVLT